MAARTKKLMLLYLMALIGYAALGAYNQGLFRRHLSLMDAKRAGLDHIVDLRGQAAEITGPLAVREWAEQQGMIAYTEVKTSQPVAVYPAPPPTFVAPQGGLEIRTIWQ